MKPKDIKHKVILNAPEFEPPKNRSIYREQIHDRKGNLLGEVEMYDDDLSKLREAGFAGKFFTKTTQGRRYVVIQNPSVIGEHSVVARLILNTRKGLTVRYRDGNRFNLKRDNLYYRTGRAKGETPVDGDRFDDTLNLKSE